MAALGQGPIVERFLYAVDLSVPDGCWVQPGRLRQLRIANLLDMGDVHAAGRLLQVPGPTGEDTHVVARLHARHHALLGRFDLAIEALAGDKSPMDAPEDFRFDLLSYYQALNRDPEITALLASTPSEFVWGTGPPERTDVMHARRAARMQRSGARAKVPALNFQWLGRRSRRPLDDWHWLKEIALLYISAGATEEAERIWEFTDRFARRLNLPLVKLEHAIASVHIAVHTGRTDEAMDLAAQAEAASDSLGLEILQFQARVAKAEAARAVGDPDAIATSWRALQKSANHLATVMPFDLASEYLANQWSASDHRANTGLNDLRASSTPRSRITVNLCQSLRVARGWHQAIHGRTYAPASLLPMLEAATGQTHREPQLGWLAPGTAVLRLVMLPRRLELLLLTRRSCRLLSPRPHPRSAVNHAVGRALDHASYSSEPWKNSTALAELATVLGLDDLLAELEDSVKRLYVVGEGSLHNMPLASLPVGGRPLIERLDTGFCDQLRWRTAARPVVLGERLAVGVGSARKGSGLPSLPGAEAEVRALAALPSTRTLTGPAASFDSVMRRLEHAVIAHFATHGRFGSDPTQSGIQLYDRWWTMAMLNTRFSNLRTVVLAACQVGGTGAQTGRGTAGFASKLIDMGVDEVVSALWDTPDDSSVPLMTRLHESMDTGCDAVASLGEVQRHAIRNDVPLKAWASYVVRHAGPSAPTGLARCTANRPGLGAVSGHLFRGGSQEAQWCTR